jgi:cytochrome c556
MPLTHQDIFKNISYRCKKKKKSKRQQTLMMGTEIVPEMSVIFKQQTPLIAKNILSKYKYLATNSQNPVTSFCFKVHSEANVINNAKAPAQGSELTNLGDI